MTQESLTAAVAAVRESALSRWDNEGGAIATPVSRLPANIPQMTNARRVDLDLSPYPSLLAIEQASTALPAFTHARPENQPDAE